MGASSITITALTATPTLRGNKLVATVSATGPAANIPTLMLDNVEFFSSASNDFTTATKVGEGHPEFFHNQLVEEQTYYYWAKPRAVNGSYGAVYPVSPTGGVACTAIGMSGLAFGLANGKLSSSVSGNALTISLKTIAGNDPSASDPVYAAFPGSTLTAGNYVIRSIAAALSLTIPNGALFASSNLAFRLWLVLFDDAGTVRMAVGLFGGGSVVAPLAEAGVASATAIAGLTSVSIGTLYAPAAVTSKPFRIVGFLEYPSGLPTGGAYSAIPDVLRLFTSGMKKPGDIVAPYSNTNAGYTSGVPATQIPLDNTAPQDNEGSSTLTLTFTPSSASNSLRIRTRANLARNTAGILILTLFRDGNANALDVATSSVNADVANTMQLETIQPALKATAITLTQRYSGTGGATVYYGGDSGGQKFNGFWAGEIYVEEIMG